MVERGSATGIGSDCTKGSASSLLGLSLYYAQEVYLALAARQLLSLSLTLELFDRFEGRVFFGQA